jgi:hypothetical protein
MLRAGNKDTFFVFQCVLYLNVKKITDLSNRPVICSILCCHLVRMSLSTRAARHCPKVLDLWKAHSRLCLASMFWFCSKVMFGYIIIFFLPVGDL